MSRKGEMVSRKRIRLGNTLFPKSLSGILRTNDIKDVAILATVEVGRVADLAYQKVSFVFQACAPDLLEKYEARSETLV